MFLRSLVSQGLLGLLIGSAVLRGSEGLLWVFLLPLSTAQTGLGLPELPSLLKAEAGIVPGSVEGCDLANDLGKSSVLVAKLNRIFGFIYSP